MGKFKCSCGHVIVDQTDLLPYKAQLIPDRFFDKFFDRMEEAIDGLVSASKKGKRREWIEQNLSPDYPTDLNDAQMVDDVFSRHYWDYQRTIYQCEKCSRLWVQIGKANHFTSFMPESPDGRNVLASGTD